MREAAIGRKIPRSGPGRDHRSPERLAGRSLVIRSAVRRAREVLITASRTEAIAEWFSSEMCADRSPKVIRDHTETIFFVRSLFRNRFTQLDLVVAIFYSRMAWRSAIVCDALSHGATMHFVAV